MEPATGSFPEIVGEAGILYKPNSSDALADALEKLLTDKELYIRYAEKAADLSASRYNELVMAENLLALYKQFTGNQK